MNMQRSIVIVGVASFACGVAAMMAIAAGEERPAKISQADMAGAIFNGPNARKVTEDGAHALEVDTLTSADKRFQTGMYKAGPEHFDTKKKGYPEYEFFYILKGSIKLTDGDGTTHEIGPREAVSIPQGWKGTWDSDGYTKVWATYDVSAK
jgi:uncharacterized cupin superfamily protein